MAGLDLARVVTVKAPYPWTETEWSLGGNGQRRFRVAGRTALPCRRV
jgi:hypothetical protein